MNMAYLTVSYAQGTSRLLLLLYSQPRSKKHLKLLCPVLWYWQTACSSQPWLSSNLEQGSRNDGGKRWSLKSLKGCLPSPLKPKSPDQFSQVYRAQNPLRLRWKVKGSLCDSSLPISLKTFVSISSSASHILGHYLEASTLIRFQISSKIKALNICFACPLLN